MATIPLGGTPGVYDPRNPTLIPNFDPTVMSAQGTLDHVSPAAFAAEFPRVAATATATIGGTATSTNTVTLTVTAATISSGSLSVTYTVGASDTLDSIAEGLASLVNANANAQAVGLYATAALAVVTLNWPGPVGNSAVVSYTLSGGATETVTLSPAGGGLTGGSGPIIPINNFNFTYNAATMSFFYGIPRVLGSDLVALMVSQGMPIV